MSSINSNTRSTDSIENQKNTDISEKEYEVDVSSLELQDESPQSYNNPFSNTEYREKYFSIYEEAKYECRARFDPDFKWTLKEQKKLTWKLDLKATLYACIFFSALQMDRTNLSQALSDNLLNDLEMTTNQYNLGQTIFYVCFLGAELPSQLVAKKLGSDIWIPIQISLWSIVTICQFALKGKHGFYATRALLGLFEGGFIPDMVLWLSYFYTSSELTMRLSFFWVTMHITNILNYLIAYGILHLGGVHNHRGWQWLFLIEGLITLSIGLLAFLLMVPSPVQTKKWWNKSGWFTEREEKIIVNKVLRDDPTKGDMHNRQGLTISMLYNAIKDYYLWPIYFIGLVHMIPETTVSSYLTLLLKGMGFSTFHTNLLCIPFNFLKIITLLLVCSFSEKIKNIFGTALIQPIWLIVCIGVLRFWPGNFYNEWGTYALLTVMLAVPYIHVLMVSTTSRNSQSIKTRTISSSLYNMFAQAGSIVSANIYRADDKPLYHKGNSVLFAFALLMVPTLIGTKLFYMHINKKRDKIWNSMSEDEKSNYRLNSTDKGSKRLDFRFAH